MKIALQIVFIIFMVLYLVGAIGEKNLKSRIFFMASAIVLAAGLIATIAMF